jgi:thiamine pyrophosphokinase
MIDFTQYNCRREFKSILCLDGELPAKQFFQQFNVPIIAADGAANKLVKMHINPDLVVGDLDGIDPALITQLKTLHRPDPNSCDYQKALVYLRETDLLPTIVCGINGGALDHILNNINILLQSNSVIYTADMIGHVLN